MSPVGRKQGQADAAVLEQDAEAVLRFRQAAQRLPQPSAVEVQDATKEHEEKDSHALDEQGHDGHGLIAGEGAWSAFH